MTVFENDYRLFLPRVPSSCHKKRKTFHLSNKLLLLYHNFLVPDFSCAECREWSWSFQNFSYDLECFGKQSMLKVILLHVIQYSSFIMLKISYFVSDS